MRTVFLRALVLLPLLGLVGCSTYGGNVSEALSQVQSHQYELAEQAFEDTLGKSKKDQLLYYLETGMVRHLQGDYVTSNNKLEQAYDLADYLNSAGVGEQLAVAMTYPSKGQYRGNDYERAMINSVKAMNYIQLAQQEPENAPQHLESARVEIRRLEIMLSRLDADFGSYDQAMSEKEQTFSKLLEIFRRLEGKWFDPEDLVYRADGWGHYLSGLAYEMNGEFEDARISYQKAASVYELGFAEQYKLDLAMVQESRAAAINNALRSGFDETELIPQIDSLSTEYQQQIEELPPGYGEVVLVQNLDLIPPKGELNLFMTVNSWSRMLEIEPILMGSYEQQSDQLAWFFMLYGDFGFTDLVARYASGGLWELVEGIGTKKKIPLAPVWSLVKQTNMHEAIDGVRLAVPYYPSLDQTESGRSSLTAENSQTGESVTLDLIKVASPAQVALQEQIKNGSKDLREAFARESLQAVITYSLAKATEQEENPLGLGFAITNLVANLGVAGAETRNWLTLPREIRMQRLRLPVGEHRLQLSTNWRRQNNYVNQEVVVYVEEGQVQLVNVNTFSGTANSQLVY